MGEIENYEMRELGIPAGEQVVKMMEWGVVDGRK
jgi:hypothetical protein